MASYGRARCSYPGVFTVVTPRIRPVSDHPQHDSFARLFRQYDISFNGNLEPENIIRFDEDLLIPMFSSKKHDDDK